MLAAKKSVKKRRTSIRISAELRSQTGPALTGTGKTGGGWREGIAQKRRSSTSVVAAGKAAPVVAAGKAAPHQHTSKRTGCAHRLSSLWQCKGEPQ
jgi:hypothetical protein